MRKYGTGKAGRFAKSEASKRFDRILSLVIIVCLVGGFIVGLVIGFTCFPFAYKPFSGKRIPFNVYLAGVAVVEFIGIAVLWWLARAFEKPMTELSWERIRYLRGGQTEALVAYALEALDDRWHLFNGIAMKGGGDIDHVLIGPGGLFCVSTKSNRGRYALGKGGHICLNEGPNRDVAEAQQLAMKLRHWLEARLQAYHEVKNIPYVQAVLVVPFAYVDLPASATKVWMLDESDFCERMRNAKASLNPKTINGCVAVLKDLTGWDLVTSDQSQATPQETNSV